MTKYYRKKGNEIKEVSRREALLTLAYFFMGGEALLDNSSPDKPIQLVKGKNIYYYKKEG